MRNNFNKNIRTSRPAFETSAEMMEIIKHEREQNKLIGETMR